MIIAPDTAIAFDLDDTLYDERDYALACIENIADTFSAKTGVNAGILTDAMVAAPTPYDGLVNILGDEAGDIADFLALYRSTRPQFLPLRPDAEWLLKHLAAEHPDTPLWIITDGRVHGQTAKLEALGLRRYVAESNIIISEAIGADKHTPTPFRYAMERCPGRKWIYIGDNAAKDFHWPRLLGWHTIMLADRGRNVHAQPAISEIESDWQPHEVAESLITCL